MYKVVNKNLKSLNWIEHYEILDYLEKKEVDKILNKYKGIDTFRLEHKHNNNLFVIVHKSTKKANYYQASFFDDKGAYSDIERKSLFDIIKYLYKSYKFN
ncbi:hypothetical protein [Clostridium perfringens]|uniref:hypothetical protein n=1 Tax=Clostridium perfringens TaxID=1502 RepID=UPI0024BBF470|nr:hypothetical protein [Clostridium perfringens]EGT4141315.1 hypothetical protein [Clostridium perfringens]